MTTRVAIYSRVSREEQAEGYSIDEQVATMRQHCESHGWEVVAEYSDPGVSGTVADRPGLTEMLRDAKAGKFDLILTYQLDRFFRNLRLQLDTLSRLAQWNVGYQSVTEQFIDASTPVGKLAMSMMGSFNEYFSAQQGQKIRMGKRGRAKAGYSNSNVVPYGYRRGEDGIDYIHEKEAQWVRRMFELYATGLFSFQRLADRLNREGAPTPNEDIPWTNVTINYMLKNEYYIGVITYEDEVYEGLHEPIISQGLWDKTRVVIDRRRKNPGKKTKRHRLLAGLLFCDDCGRKLWIAGNEHSTYYKCSARASGYRCRVGKRHVHEDVVNEQAERIIKGLRLPEDWQREIEARSEKPKADNDRRRKSLEAKLERITELYIEGAISRQGYDERKREAEAELARLVEPERDAMEEATLSLQTLADSWDLADTETRHDLLSLVFEYIVVNLPQERIVAVTPHPEFAPLFKIIGMIGDEISGQFYITEAAE